MSLNRKVRSVEKVFTKLEDEIEAFKVATQLSCMAECGFCCKKPDIEATVLEFLPLAYFYFTCGVADQQLEKINNNPGPICYLFKAGQDEDAGFCSVYANRGLICRLFAFSARRDKYGKPEYMSCRKIKEYHPLIYTKAFLDVKNGLKVPFISSYYQQLRHIDYELADKMYPVNIAVKKAIEIVKAYYAYRRIPCSSRTGIQIRGSIPMPGVSQERNSDPQ